MVGELDAGNPHVQFDEGVQETCDSATRLCPTLPQPLVISRLSLGPRDSPQRLAQLFRTFLRYFQTVSACSWANFCDVKACQ
jgi:hypothetical protein